MPNSLKKYGEINIKIENGKIIHLIGQTLFDIPMGDRNLFIFSSLNRNVLLSFDNLRYAQEQKLRILFCYSIHLHYLCIK